MIFTKYLYLIQLSKGLRWSMRKRIHWGAAFAANALIYASDLYGAVATALNLIVRVLL